MSSDPLAGKLAGSLRAPGRSRTRVKLSPSVVHGNRDFSLISTAISCHPSWSLAGMHLHLVARRRRRSYRPLRLTRRPLPPDLIERHDHEPDQRPTTSPLVPHLLQEPEHPIRPLHVIVGPHPTAQRVLEIGHHLGELLVAQLVQR